MSEHFSPSNLAVATTVFIILTILIMITILFEVSKDYLLESSSKYTKPIYQQLFSEMTVLGFLSLMTFVVCFGGTLENFSESIYGENGRMFLQHSLESIHYLLFFVMILTIIEVMLLASIATDATKDFAYMNVISQDEDSVTSYIHEFNNQSDLSLLKWISDYIFDPIHAYSRHLKRKKIDSIIVFYALRHEFIRHRSPISPYDTSPQSMWLPLNFDFGTYQSNCMSLLLVDVVNFTPYTWIAIWVVTALLYSITLAVKESYEVFAIIWLLFGYLDLFCIYAIDMKCQNIIYHLINPELLRTTKKPYDHLILNISDNDNVHSIQNNHSDFLYSSVNTSLPTDTSVLNINLNKYDTFNNINKSNNKSGLLDCSLKNLKNVQLKKPLYTTLEDHKQNFLQNLFGFPIVKNKHLQLFWGGIYGPQLNIYLLRIHLIIEAIYITIASVFVIPYVFNNMGILIFIIYTIFTALPILIQFFGLYSDLIINISNVSSTGLLRQSRVVQEIIRQQKASKVVKFLMMLTRLKLHSRNKMDIFDKESIAKHHIDLSDLNIQAEISDISKIFEFYDKDKSGEISKEEMFELMSTLGFLLSEEEAEAAYQAVDLDGNGSISKEEFIKWHLFHRDLDHGNKHENLKEIAREIFQVIDEDNSGEVTIEEFQSALNKLDAGLTSEEIAGIIRDFDEDGSGTISLEEFENFIHKSSSIA